MNSIAFNPEQIRYFNRSDGQMYYGGIDLALGSDVVHMLWTGACAIDGQPVYQGDVVRTQPWDLGMLIEWDESLCRFVYKASIRGELTSFPLNREWAAKNLVIMGNVYQSPELWPH